MRPGWLYGEKRSENIRGDYEEILLDNERWHGPVQVFDNN